MFTRPTFLVAILALAAFVRVYGLGTEDYWLDELHSMANSAGRRAELEALPVGIIVQSVPRPTDMDGNSSLAAVWATMRHDSHPPLYFMLLYGWRRLFGDGEAAVRCLPVLFSVLTIIPIVLILGSPPPQSRSNKSGPSKEQPRAESSKEIDNRKSTIDNSHSVGLIAGLILALAFTHIWMAQENRPYSLSLFLTACSYYFFVRLESYPNAPMNRTPWLAAFAYVLCVYTALLTHYFAGLAILGQGVYALLCFRGPVLRWWLASVALAGLAAAATWGPALVSQLDFIRAQPWLLEQTPDHAWRTTLRLGDLPVRFLFDCELFRTSLLQSALGVMLFSGATILAWRCNKRYALLFLLWFAVPVITLALLDLTTDKQLLTYLRYSSIAVPGIAGLLALSLDRLRGAVRAIVLLAFTVVMVWRLNLPAMNNPDSRGAAAQLQATAQPRDLVVFDTVGLPGVWMSLLFVPMSYYLPDFQGFVVLQRDPPDPDLLKQIESFSRIIVVSPRIDALPHPSPETHEPSWRSEYFHKVGWIYLFVQKQATESSSAG